MRIAPDLVHVIVGINATAIADAMCELIAHPPQSAD
jgi:hypothetical protein